jgi:C4-dicarboxylate-binding protein DctP
VPISRRSALAFSVAGALGAVGVGAISTRTRPARTSRTVIRFSHVVAEDTPKGRAANYLRTLLHEATGGEVVVDVFPNSTLYKDKEELEALHMGSVEMVAPSLAKLGPLGIRDFEIFDLPFIFDGYPALHRVTDGPVGTDLMERLSKTGLLGLAFWDNGFKQMSANRPLLLPEDFRGLRMRIQESEVLEAQMKALGAIPDPMALSDVYMALKTGVVDGTENPASNFLTQQIYKVQKFMTLSNHGYLGYVVIVKERFWLDLSSDVRRAVKESLAKATAFANEIAKSDNDNALRQIRAIGGTSLVQLDDGQRASWKKSLAVTHSEFRKRMGSGLLDAVYAASKTQPMG